MLVTENAGRETTTKFDRELEAIRVFHTGPLKRCSQCGRMVFLPCLFCETERKVKVSDPFDAVCLDSDELRVELQGEERKRYEYFHLTKIADEVRRRDQEEAALLS